MPPNNEAYLERNEIMLAVRRAAGGGGAEKRNKQLQDLQEGRVAALCSTLCASQHPAGGEERAEISVFAVNDGTTAVTTCC